VQDTGPAHGAPELAIIASLLYLCAMVQGMATGNSTTDRDMVLLSKLLVASLLYLCALLQGEGPAQQMGCGALEQACPKPSVPMCTGAGCGTAQRMRLHCP
jgi:hypothetical protein